MIIANYKFKSYDSSDWSNLKHAASNDQHLERIQLPKGLAYKPCYQPEEPELVTIKRIINGKLKQHSLLSGLENTNGIVELGISSVALSSSRRRLSEYHCNYFGSEP
jgi:hypothetical protein